MSNDLRQRLNDLMALLEAQYEQDVVSAEVAVGEECIRYDSIASSAGEVIERLRVVMDGGSVNLTNTTIRMETL